MSAAAHPPRTGPRPGGAALRILHLEDSGLDRELIRSILQAEGLDCEIRQVHERGAFVEALQEGGFDLILSDFSLPQFDGLSALDAARQRRPDVPFLLVSGTLGEERAVESLKHGATDYILKQNLSRLGPAVRRAVEESRERAARRAAEEALRESEERYRSVVAALHEGVLLLDEGGAVSACNPSAERILRRSAPELLGRPPSQTAVAIIREDGTPFPAPELPGLVTLRTGEPRSQVVMGLRQPDGSVIWISVSSRPLYRPGAGRPHAAVVSFGDVTERKRGEEETERLEEQLRQAQKMEAVGRLAGGVAHDFNNILGVITGYGELARKALAPGDPVRRRVEAMVAAAQRAAGLTRQLLAFSRRQVLQPKVIDLNAMARDMHDMLRRLIGEDVQLETRLEDGLGRVKADASQIEQVLLNLAVNARDAMPGGGRLLIETANVELEEGESCREVGLKAGRCVLLSVTDSGTGMDETTRSRIFEPFFTTKEPGKGTGLGLATVYGIVRQSGGAIRVDSEPGSGTRFRIYLPRVEEEPEAARQRPAVSPRAGSETLLLVEDDPALRQTLREMLEEGGYTVLAAEGPAEALALTEKHPGTIHLVLTDMVMPEMNGRALSDRLAVLRGGMKVIYMSGYTDDAIPGQAGASLVPGAAFLEKPFTPDGVLGKIREVLDGPSA